jgi:hypothetical protein
MVGQERSKEKTALAAEPCSASDSRLNFVRQPWSSRREFQSHTTTPEGVALAYGYPSMGAPEGNNSVV